jgi:hypothetical protein
MFSILEIIPSWAVKLGKLALSVEKETQHTFINLYYFHVKWTFHCAKKRERCKFRRTSRWKKPHNFRLCKQRCKLKSFCFLRGSFCRKSMRRRRNWTPPRGESRTGGARLKYHWGNVLEQPEKRWYFRKQNQGKLCKIVSQTTTNENRDMCWILHRKNELKWLLLKKKLAASDECSGGFFSVESTRNSRVVLSNILLQPRVFCVKQNKKINDFHCSGSWFHKLSPDLVKEIRQFWVVQKICPRIYFGAFRALIRY